MKVLHIIPAISIVYGGPSVAMRMIASTLIHQEVQVDIATTTASGSEELNVATEVRVEQNGIGYYFFLSKLGEWKFSWGLTKWLRQNIYRYDLIHVHAVFCYPGWPACRLARKYKVPYIIRPAGILDPWCFQQKSLKKQLYYRLIEKRNLQGAAVIHATTEMEARHLRALGLDKIAIIPHAVEQSVLIRQVEGVLKILFLSRLDVKKGLPVLFQAMALLKQQQKQVLLTIAGHGAADYEAQLRQQVIELKITDKVNFIGFVTGKQKQKILQENHIFVLPSYQENFAVAAAEALAAGLPVVISDKIGIADDVLSYRAGKVVAVDQPEALAAAILAVSEIEVWQQASQNALRLAQEKYSVEALGKSLVSLYKKLLEK